MKKIYLLFLLALTFATGYSQSTLELAKQLDKENIKVLKANVDKIIKSREFSNSAEDKKELVLKLNKFLINPFDKTINSFSLIEAIKALNSMIPIVNEMSIGSSSSNPNRDKDRITGISKTLETTAGLTSDIVPGQAISTKIIDATAKFLVDRTKQELTITFFENFRDKLNEEIKVTLKDGNVIKLYLKDVFPKTFLLLNNKNYFDIPSFGEVWLVAFKKDINEMPQNINEIIKRNTFFYATQEGHFAVLAVDIIKELKEGQHPLQVIEEVSETSNNYKFHSDQIIGLLELFSSNLQKEEVVDGVKKAVLITSEDLKKLDESSTKYFTGLIYQAGLKNELLQNLTIGNVTLADHITQEKYLKFYIAIKSARANYQKFDKLLTDIRKENPDSLNYYRKYSQYLNSFYSVFNESVESVYAVADKTDLYYTSYYYEQLKPLIDDVIGLNTAVSEENYAECLLLTTDFLNHLVKSENKIIKDFGYYGNFVTDIVYASKNDTDVKKIIENYAMPVASYRIKRLYKSSWDVNAFPGLYVGYEFSESNSLNYGVTAPIGFSYSRKNTNCRDFNTSSSSSSVFLSVIDIGAPFSYRFTHDEAEGLPEDIKWEQVFAPGLFYIFGFNNTPLAVAAGVQFTPLLRKIETNNVLDTKNVVRASISLFVDIPMFNLYKSENPMTRAERKIQRKIEKDIRKEKKDLRKKAKEAEKAKEDKEKEISK